MGGGGLFFGFGGFGGYASFGTQRDTLGEHIRAAQLSDFFASKARSKSRSITTSAALPGDTHWNPPGGGSQASISVGTGGAPAILGRIFGKGEVIPAVDMVWPGAIPWPPRGQPTDRSPDFVDTGPPVVFTEPPIILPGQSSPGREEREAEVDKVQTWGDFATGVVQGVISNLTGTSSASGLPPGFVSPNFPMTVPATNGATGEALQVNLATGKITKCRRKRRRVMLTAGDLAVLHQISTLPNTKNVSIALAKRIR